MSIAARLERTAICRRPRVARGARRAVTAVATVVILGNGGSALVG